MPNLHAFIENVEARFLVLNAIVEQFPQGGVVRGQFLTMDRAELADFEQQLATASGKRVGKDNVYSIAQDDCPTLYVRFYDEQADFGLTIR